jgi:hypothetical protein
MYTTVGIWAEKGGLLRGSITIGARTAPVPAAVEVDGTLELFAVPGSWRKLWLCRQRCIHRGL